MGIYFYFRIIKYLFLFFLRGSTEINRFLKKNPNRYAKLCKLTRPVLCLVWIDVFIENPFALFFRFPLTPQKNLNSKTSEVQHCSLITTKDACQWTSFSATLGLPVRVSQDKNALRMKSRCQRKNNKIHFPD